MAETNGVRHDGVWRDGWSLTTGEVAQFLQLSPRTVQELFDDGALAGYRHGWTRRFTRDGVLAYMKKIGMPVPPELDFPRRVLLVGPATVGLGGAFDGAGWRTGYGISAFAAGVVAGTLRPLLAIVDRDLGLLVAAEIRAVLLDAPVVLLGDHERWDGEQLDAALSPGEVVRWCGDRVTKTIGRRSAIY